MARSKGILTIVEALRGHTSHVVRTSAIAIVERLTSDPPIGTPVDTGHARSNWIATTGAPFSGVAGSKQAVTTAPQDAALATLILYDLDDGPIYITNNVPYIRKLNDEGTSRQSPRYFVQQAVGWVISNIRNLV